jgi:outer membrane protein OmpA-like peptidoglycan-associated protein
MEREPVINIISFEKEGQMVREKLFLALLMLILSHSMVVAQGSRRIVLNHFIADPDQRSIVYITDAEGVSQDVKVNFLDERGDIIGQKKISLPPNGTVPIKPFDVIQRRAYGKVVAEASSRVLGEYWQIIETEDSGYSVAVPFQAAIGHDRLLVQHFVSDKGLTANIYISDTRGRGDIPVEIAFYDERSALLSTINRTVPSNGSITIKPWDVLKKKAVGSAYIISKGGPIVGEYWQIVSGKFKDPKTGKDFFTNYAVGLPLAGRIDTPLKIVETPTQIRLTIEVHFDVDKAVVRDVDKPNLEEAAKVISRYFSDGEVIEVEGHTDESGEADYNMKLSEERADNVKAYLVSNLGLKDSQLKAIGYGEMKPVVPGAVGEAGYINRRVVFSIPKI